MADTDKSREIIGAGKQMLSSEGDINNQLKERLKTLEKVSKAYEDINAKIKASEELGKDLKSLEFDIFKNLKDQVKIKENLEAFDESTFQSVKRKKTELQESLKQEKEAENALSKLKRDALFLSEQELRIQRLKISSAEESLENIQAHIEAQKESLTNQELQVMALQEADELNQKTLLKLKERAVQEKMISQRMGITGGLLKGSYGILNKLGIGSFMRLDEITKKMQLEAQAGAGKWKILKMAIGETFAAIGEALKDPVTQLTILYKLGEALVKSAIAYQAKFFEAAKNLGTGVTESKRLFENFQAIAWQNGKLAMTAKQLVESYSKINEQLGFMGPRNEEFLTFATAAERRLGLGAQDMENLYLFSASTGKSVKDTYANIVASTKMQGMRLKMQMSEKQIMQAISKVSATVFNNFKGDVQQIALAVQKATKLGTTLDQVNSAGMQMLDFESSIAKEFEAQLMTGKNLDLSRARQLALTGKTEDLMKEMSKQLGSQAEWGKMNVLQQQSLAEALGMSKESVDDMFKKQQLANALGKEANADAMTQYKLLQERGYTQSQISEMMGQQAVSDLMAASVQDKMAATMERIQDTIGKMSQALMPIIEGFANIVSNATSLKILLGGAAVVAGLIATSSIMAANAKRQEMASLLAQVQINNALLSQQTGLLTAEQARAEIEIIRAGASSTAGAGYLGPAALAVGAAVITGLMAYLSSTGGSSSAPTPSVPSSPSTGMSPTNFSAQNAASNRSAQTMMSSPGNERPVNVTFQAQVVDTATNMSGRFSRGVDMDQTNMN